MSKLTDLADRFRDHVWNEMEHQDNLPPLKSLPVADQIRILEYALEQLKTIRVYRPDKIISKAIMVPSYRRRLAELKTQL